MELKEAVERVQAYSEFIKCSLANNLKIAVISEEDAEAIDTILNYIENESISKEKVEKMIKKCRERRIELANGHFWENSSNVNEDTALVLAQTTLEELLKE